MWLPPEYQQPQFHSAKFPVMVLPGQPSTPEAMFRHYDFGQVASTLMNAGRIKPFIAVFPPLMTNPPRDTECTNIRGGPQAYTWLSSMVPRRRTPPTTRPTRPVVPGRVEHRRVLWREAHAHPTEELPSRRIVWRLLHPDYRPYDGRSVPRRRRRAATQLAAVALPASWAARAETIADLRSTGQRVLESQPADAGREPRRIAECPSSTSRPAVTTTGTTAATCPTPCNGSTTSMWRNDS